MLLVRFYNYLVHDLGDPRNRHIALLHTPWPSLCIVAAYVWLVRVLGPRLMRHRQPFAVERAMRVYNVVQIVWNIYMGYIGISYVMQDNFDWFCMPLDYSDSEIGKLVRLGGILYYFNKIFDLCDTVFFILRKKFEQANHLHVYHHSMMVIGAWIGVKYIPSGNPVFVGVINTWIHVLMYTYYLLASMGFNRVWWKKHLTQLQIAQFAFILLHNGQLLAHNPCGFPLPLALFAATQALYMLRLFLGFYRRAYLRPAPQSADRRLIDVLRGRHPPQTDRSRADAE